MFICKICGCEYTPTIDNHYIARDNGESGVSTVFSRTEENLYDAFDCPTCGCQIIAQERKRNYVQDSLTLGAVQEDDDE